VVFTVNTSEAPGKNPIQLNLIFGLAITADLLQTETMMMRNILFAAVLGFTSFSYAIEFSGASKGETENPQDFPATGFSFGKCSERIPVKPGKNPWLKVAKRKGKQAPMNPDPPSVVESYYVTPGNKEKRFSIINQEDSIYNAPTTLARIDCKHGLIYFQNLIREPVPTNQIRVYDLISGEEYRVTEGAVTISPDGSYMLAASASDRDQKCGSSPSCDINIKVLQCKKRKSQGSACEVLAEKKYTVTKGGKAAAFSVVPVKWNWNKHKKELKATLGGSSRSPSKIICKILPKYSCSVAKKGALEFSEKE